MVEIVRDISIRIDDRQHILGVNLIRKPNRRHSDDPLGLELVGIEEIASQGLLVIGLIGDIRQDKNTRLVGV